MTGPEGLGFDVLTGPAAFLAAIVWAGYLVAREIRKIREADVGELTTKVDELEAKVDAGNARVSEIKEQHMAREDALQARLVRARSMLVEHGVPVEDLP